MASLPSAHIPVAATTLAAPGPAYGLTVARDASARLATGWLALGIGALVGSGIFSLLLVLARTPGLKEVFPVADFFQVALVAHVDLSVLVWFVSFAGVLWSLACDERAIGLGWVALALCGAGTVALCVAPLAPHAVPVLANYIPVIDNAVFLGGLARHRRRRRARRRAHVLVGPALQCHPGRRGGDTLGSARFRGRHRRRAGRVLLVVAGDLAAPRTQGLLRAALLGRRPRAAVHLDAPHAGRLAVARLRARAAARPLAARHAPHLHHRARQRLRDAGHLHRAPGGLGRAPQAADVAHALRRRARDSAYPPCAALGDAQASGSRLRSRAPSSGHLPPRSGSSPPADSSALRSAAPT